MGDKERIKIEIEKLKDEKENLMFEYGNMQTLIYNVLIIILIMLFISSLEIIYRMNNKDTFFIVAVISSFVILILIFILISLVTRKLLNNKISKTLYSLQQKIQEKYGELLE
ncbi:MAG: hypothetical protein QW103_01735 [Candidatus Pacearchaeota archaeon]